MSWAKTAFIKDSLVILLISVLILTVLNFAFVYSSPSLVRLLPQHFVRKISPCYRTLFHYDGHDIKQSNFVFGDSYSEGSGDEFLQQDPGYGIFNKLENSGEAELVFGRSGYGNRGAVIEFERCFALLSTFTNFSPDLVQSHVVTFVFYEGNDLNDNLVEADREFSNIEYNLLFFVPVFEYIYRSVPDLFKRSVRKKAKSRDGKGFPQSASGIAIGRYPQSAATELSDAELSLGLSVLKDSLARIREILPEAKAYRLLYLPSVASSYHIEDVMRVQSNNGLKYYETTGAFNASRSLDIRNHLGEVSRELGWDFCDTTQALLDVTDQGVAVHGPRDWKHFNKPGYAAVAGAYERCFFSGATALPPGD